MLMKRQGVRRPAGGHGGEEAKNQVIENTWLS